MGLAGPTRQISGRWLYLKYPNDGYSTQVVAEEKQMRRPEIHLSHACACTTTHLHDGGQPDGAVPEDRQALVGAPEIAAPADHGHAAVRGHFPGAYLVPEEGQDVGGRTDPSHAGIGQGPQVAILF